MRPGTYATSIVFVPFSQQRDAIENQKILRAGKSELSVSVPEKSTWKISVYDFWPITGPFRNHLKLNPKTIATAMARMQRRIAMPKMPNFSRRKCP